jgi:hypothetical protein
VTPWIQRGGNGPRTHALIVGVSAYAHLPRGDEPPPADRETFGLRQLESAAAGAAAFAAWMRDEYANPDAPLGSVWLLLSPSDRETEHVAALGAPQPPRATAAATREALSDWVQACSDPQHVAIAYLAGHGVMLSKDEGAVVLLEDFAADPLDLLANAFDVSAVRSGFGRPEMAQRQLWLVDACAVRPTALGRIEARGGVRLDGDPTHSSEISAVLTSAAPSTLALGLQGKGTLFSQALLECLERRAAVPTAEGSWAVTGTSLAAQVPVRVEELAAANLVDQRATAGGWWTGEAIHVYDEPPKVEVVIEADPEDAGPYCYATLGNGYEELFRDEPLRPRIIRAVPAGYWTVDVVVQPETPPYLTRRGVPCPAMPPAVPRQVVRMT